MAGISRNALGGMILGTEIQFEHFSFIHNYQYQYVVYVLDVVF